jgi:putative sigma-54 modulation protein
MEVNISAKNVKINDNIRRHIERKLGKLSLHLPGIEEIRIDLREQPTHSPKDRFIAQVTVGVRGTLLRSEERNSSLLNAIDRAADVMDRQINHFKGKHYNNRIRNREQKGESDIESAVTNRVIKVKHFSPQPMSIDEAIEQIELLGHDFLLFYDIVTRQLKLLYSRKNDDYSLMEIREIKE